MVLFHSYSTEFDITEIRVDLANAICANPFGVPVKRESRKERINRLALSKMKASWKSFDRKKNNIIKVKQVCRPRDVFNKRSGRICY